MEARLQISAAEIEKYAYCPLNWWLYKQGVGAKGKEQEEGREKHLSLAEDLSQLLQKEDRARQWETLVLYFAVAASLAGVLGVAFLQQLDLRIASILSVLSLIWLLAATYLLYRAERLVSPEDRLIAERLLLLFAMVATVIALLSLPLSFWQDRTLASILEVVALVWLVGASYFLYKSLRALNEARVVRLARRLGEAPIDYVDDPSGEPELLVSDTYGVTGRPDFITREGGPVPVEVKMGRKPRGPLFSHILQVTAYCLLVEESTGQRPPYGLLKYGDAVHEIEYTDELRSLLLSKLEEMRRVADSQEAHRNHNRPGKCARCSRRHACPERLA